ncbi:hypothetical protein Trydic_g22392 [Trypoxylus dichotomus]
MPLRSKNNQKPFGQYAYVRYVYPQRLGSSKNGVFPLALIVPDGRLTFPVSSVAVSSWNNTRPQVFCTSKKRYAPSANFKTRGKKAIRKL